MGGGDKVDVVGSLVLESQKDIPEFPDGHLFSEALMTDLVVLAEAAVQRTAAEKHGAASSPAAYGGFLPVVEGGSGHFGFCPAPAETGPAAAVRGTLAGTQPAAVVSCMMDTHKVHLPFIDKP